MGFVLVVIIVLSLLLAFFYRRKRESDMTAGTKSLGYLILAVIALVSLFFGKNRTMVFAGQVMFLAFVGMIYCARLQKVYANAQSMAVKLFIVVIGCGITILTLTFASNETARLIANELKFAKAASFVMGEELAELYPNSKALVVVDENYEKSKRQKEMLDGLKEGLGDKIEIAAIDNVKVPPPEGVTNPEEIEMFPMWERMRAEHFDNLLREHKDCDLIISMIGLPYDVGEMEIWRMAEEDRPKVALLFADVHNLGRAIYAGYLTALTYKPGVKFTEDPAPSDAREAFNKRYIILNKENVKDYRQMFSQ
jgi:hypothetical protein